LPGKVVSPILEDCCMIASAINAVLLALLTVLPTAAGSQRSADDVKKEDIDEKVVVSLGDEDLDVDTDTDDPVVVHVGRRGFLGVRLIEITPELRAHFGAPRDAGVLVAEVDADTPAAKGGIEVGDVITAVDGTSVGWTGDVSRAIGRKKGGETAQIDLVRGRASRRLAVKVEERRGRERSIDLGDLGDHVRRHAWVMRDLEKVRPLLGEGLSGMRKRMAELEKRLSVLEKRLK
jgi:membrane-associated protease RseP (regulator of RpoE activity)